MSDSAAYLVVTSTTMPGRAEQAQTYASKVVPLLVKGGAEPVARYGVDKQLGGEGGPQSIAVLRFPTAQAITVALSTDEFKQLTGLRDEAFSRVDQMICSAL